MNIPKQTKALNRQFQPTGRAWNYIHGPEQVDTETFNFIDGLNNPFVDGFGNNFVSQYSVEASHGKRLTNAFLKSYERLYEDIFSLNNQILANNDGFDEIDASNWERVFGLVGKDLDLDTRKNNILRKQSYPQGVAERGNYLLVQEQLQAAGFDVYITENRFADGSGGWDVINPANNQESYTICVNRIEEELDKNYFSVQDQSEMGDGQMGVIEMLGASLVPTSDQLRATFFIGGSTFPNSANVPLLRKDEFRHLILKLKPAQTLAYLYINYI